MAAKYDPNLELNPNKMLLAVAIFMVAGFCVVGMIVTDALGSGDGAPTAAAAPAE